MSTGLWYAPGSYSLTDEVIALNQPVADRDKLYSSHIRSEADDLCGLFPAHAKRSKSDGGPVVAFSIACKSRRSQILGTWTRDTRRIRARP